MAGPGPAGQGSEGAAPVSGEFYSQCECRGALRFPDPSAAELEPLAPRAGQGRAGQDLAPTHSQSWPIPTLSPQGWELVGSGLFPSSSL